VKRNSFDSSFDEKFTELLVGLSLSSTPSCSSEPATWCNAFFRMLPQKAWPLQLADLTPIGNIGFYCETIEHYLGFVEAV